MSGPEVALVVIGAILMLGAIAWRSAVHRSAKRQVEQLLRAPDASARRSALDLVGSDGLAPHANALVDLVHHESDPAVLDAVADLVARNSWEPADQPRLVELRLWARQRLSAQHATQPAELAQAGTPRPQPEAQNRPLRPERDPLLHRLERALDERVLALRIQRPDGTVELDVFDAEGASAWR